MSSQGIQATESLRKVSLDRSAGEAEELVKANSHFSKARPGFSVEGGLGGRQGDGSGSNWRDPEDARQLQETCMAFPQTLRRQNRQGRASDWMQGGGREEPGTTPEDLAGKTEHLVVLLIKLEKRERRAGLEKITSLVLDILAIISSKF